MILSACGAILLVSTSLTAQQPPRDDIRLEIARARELLATGQFRQAESAYVALIARIPEEERGSRAASYFGRAVAAQQRLLAGDTVDKRTSLDTIVSSYKTARSLNESTLGAAAENNLALLSRTLGQHGEAIEHFTAAASLAAPSARAAFLFNAGREYEAVGDRAKAAAMYEQTLKADSGASDALRALLSIQVAIAPANAVLRTAGRWRTDSTSAGIVVDALSSLMLRSNMPLSDPEATTALFYLAEGLPVARIGPASFAITLRDRLRQAARARPALSQGLGALIDAYEVRTAAESYHLPVEASWWRSNGLAAQAAWSSVLRALGDWYDQQGELPIARSFYEEALGLQSGNIDAPWVDRRALLPLALIYTQSDSLKGNQLQRQVNRYTAALFFGKGQAYARGDLEQIREFHTALGAIYAAQGVWTGPDARNAEFQLEHMRKTSRALARVSARPVTDPSELLEKLAVHYQQTGRTNEANTLKMEIRDDYIERGRPAAADSAVHRIEQVRTLPPKAETVPDGPAATRVKTRTGMVEQPNQPAAAPAKNQVVLNRSATANAQQSMASPLLLSSTIQGRIVDSKTRRPLANVPLTLITDGMEHRVTTDSIGRFAARLPRGASSSHVRIQLQGYELFEQSVRPGKSIEFALMPVLPQKK